VVSCHSDVRGYVPDVTVQSGGSDTLPLGEDRISKGSSHPPSQFQISG
jgi:hypothetical protein